MQNISAGKPAKTNYDFVDTIRCISMIFIVMEHSIYFEPTLFHPAGLKEIIYCSFIQISKFGTINFFLLAGFLLGDKFTTYTPFEYLKRRFNSTIWPWLFWSVMFIIVTNFDVIISLFRFDSNSSGSSEILLNNIKTTYLYTMYWFIPNFLFCISFLLVFKKFLYNYLFGGILLFFTVFYSVNIYFSWVHPGHTTAIFGFVFFLWLGSQLNRNWEKIDTWINKTPLLMWWGLFVITACLGVVEIAYLKSSHNNDPYNSLRISNIAFSICCFFLLLKIRNFKIIQYLKPRETTYGIYLIHYIFLAYMLPKVFGPLNINIDQLNIALLVIYQLTRFLILYGLTMIMVRLLNQPKLKWLIGR